MEALDIALTKAILSPKLKVSPLPMAVGVQWGDQERVVVAACGGRDGDPHFCSQRHLAHKNPSAHGLFQAGLSLSRSGFGGYPPFPYVLPPKVESRRPAKPKQPKPTRAGAAL